MKLVRIKEGSILEPVRPTTIGKVQNPARFSMLVLAFVFFHHIGSYFSHLFHPFLTFLSSRLTWKLFTIPIFLFFTVYSYLSVDEQISSGTCYYNFRSSLRLDHCHSLGKHTGSINCVGFVISLGWQQWPTGSYFCNRRSELISAVWNTARTRRSDHNHQCSGMFPNCTFYYAVLISPSTCNNCVTWMHYLKRSLRNPFTEWSNE